MINEPLDPRRSSMGSSNTLLMPNTASDGPMPRSTTALLLLPVMMKPAIMALSPVSTRSRVEIFKAWTGLAVGVAVGVAVAVAVGVAVAVEVGVAVAVAVGVAVAVAVAVAVGVGLGVGVGVTSSFRIVPVPSAFEMVALSGLLRCTVKVSSGSTIVSPLTSTVICLVVSAGWKVKLAEEIAVKSDGAVAVPLTVL